MARKSTTRKSKRSSNKSAKGKSSQAKAGGKTDGKLLWQDGTARVWDATTGKLIGTDVEKELGQVLSQLEALQKTVEKLRDRVKKGRTAETPSPQRRKKEKQPKE